MYKLLLFLILPPLFACSHVLPQEALDKVDDRLTFNEVMAAPEAHLGQTLLLGGVIMGLETAHEGSTLEVYRWKLAPWGEPVELDNSGGRFLVETDRLLAADRYVTGRLITLTARVSGTETRPLGRISYTYPVLRLQHEYLWETPFRYMTRRDYNVYTPIYLEQGTRERTNPYDPAPYDYPYLPYDIRY